MALTFQYRVKQICGTTPLNISSIPCRSWECHWCGWVMNFFGNASSGTIRNAFVSLSTCENLDLKIKYPLLFLNSIFERCVTDELILTKLHLLIHRSQGSKPISSACKAGNDFCETSIQTSSLRTCQTTKFKTEPNWTLLNPFPNNNL